ncbi:DUF2877 domain-containing protein [Halanaerobium sp. ST460_2HS_T2]|uniref:DUF2877 domain-containing protein n=1 Tax=Halanaerobium sp. ST460_2HS_T2 TaxID=2183914 RepID=UPI000E01AAB8|nr:DUF2877 domain-containing protein [Halanaerobium sp. ST460_2HS_T2]RCW62477.1 uncharacterized protein DUF2877 [Halanaerobium sp. ST460_2HS_T2]
MLKQNQKIVDALSLSLDFEEKLLTGNLNFKIHSIYNRVINLIDELDDLYSIVLRTIDNAPHTLRINSAMSFKKRNIIRQDKIQISDNKLFISNKLVIELAKYNLFKSRLQDKMKLESDILKRNLKECFSIIRDQGSSGGAKYFYQKRFTIHTLGEKPGTIEREFADRIEKYIIVESKKPEKIIGFGMGLTPSGDDFLSGYFLTMAFLNNNYSEKVFKNLKLNLARIEVSTTVISRAMLNRVLELKTRENIKNLILSLNAEGPRFRSYLKEVLKIGSSSGTDISIGIMTAYQEILLNMEDGG